MSISGFIIGITGKTGAGKTTISRIIEKYGFKILDADKIAHDLLDSDVECKKMIRNEFGEDIFEPNMKINRQILAERAFITRNSLYKLNKITHPYIFDELEKRINKMRLNGERAVLDAAALFESGADKLCDFTVFINTSEDIRIKRVIKRDDISREMAMKRSNAQAEDSFYISRADFFIDGSLSMNNINEKIKNLLFHIGGF